MLQLREFARGWVAGCAASADLDYKWARMHLPEAEHTDFSVMAPSIFDRSRETAPGQRSAPRKSVIVSESFFTSEGN
jgi:hypothetical protein